MKSRRKRIFGVVVVFCLMLSCMAGFSPAALGAEESDLKLIFTMDKDVVNPGEEVTVTVSLSNYAGNEAINGIRGMQIDISFDPGMVEYVAGSAKVLLSTTQAFLPPSVSYANNNVNFLYAGTAAQSLERETAELFSFKVKAKEIAASSEMEFGVNFKPSDRNNAPIPASFAAPSISITVPGYGPQGSDNFWLEMRSPSAGDIAVISGNENGFYNKINTPFQNNQILFTFTYLDPSRDGLYTILRNNWNSAQNLQNIKVYAAADYAADGSAAVAVAEYSNGINGIVFSSSRPATGPGFNYSGTHHALSNQVTIGIEAGLLSEGDYVLVFGPAIEAEMRQESFMTKTGNTGVQTLGKTVVFEFTVEGGGEPPVNADKDALAALVSDAEKLNQADYTAGSWAPFAAALEAAKGVLANEEAAQEEVDAAAAALQEAMDGLKAAPVADPVCEINGKGYATLAEALLALKDGDMLKLLENITYNTGVTIIGIKVTLDLNGYTLDVVNASGNGLTVGNGGALYLTGEGAFNVTGSSRGVYAYGGSTAEVTNVTGTVYGVLAMGVNTSVSVSGDVTGGEGVEASGSANVAVGGNVTGTGSTYYGVRANGGTITVGGDAVGVWYGAQASNSGRVTVGGDVKGNYAAYATSGGTIEVGGNAIGGPDGLWGNYGAYASGAGSVITVKGNATATGADSAGVFAESGGKVTVEGEISASAYIKLGTAVKAKNDGVVSVTKPGYLEYTDGTNYVWVKSEIVVPPQVDKDALAALVTQAEALKQVDYTAASWAVFAAALNAAKEVLADEEATQEMVDSAAAALQTAKDGLTKRLVPLPQDENGVYLIGSAEDLILMSEMSRDAENGAEYRGAKYRLTANIDMEGYAWTSIGNFAAANLTNANNLFFTGEFDGCGFTIFNLKSTDRGLFAMINGGSVYNLKLENINVIAAAHIGGIVGYMNAGTISNCSVSGSLTGTGNGTNYLGGIAGLIAGGAKVENCTVIAVINGTGQLGGIVGSLTLGTVTNCYVDAAISGTQASIGGIAGTMASNAANKIEGCYVRGTVNSNQGTVTSNVGGILGNMSGMGTVANSVFDGEVKSTGGAVGGIVGYVGSNAGAKVENCIALGIVRGSGTNIGGVAGWVGGLSSLTNCVALNETVESTTGGMVARLVGGKGNGAGVVTGFAWDGMTLIPAAGSAGDIAGTDISRTELAAWPVAAMTGGLWFYEEGKLPVLAAFKDLISNEFPAYMGEPEAPAFFAGSGTVNDPYQIASMDDLRLMVQLINSGDAAYASAFYALTKNITYDNMGFIPIGSSNNPFAGQFDGKGFSIIGLVVSGSNNVGLFGCINGGTVKNLNLVNCAITATGNYAGGIVAYMENGTIDNCVFSGAVSGTQNVGGIAGFVFNSSVIQNCKNEGAVEGTTNVGGIVGNVRSISGTGNLPDPSGIGSSLVANCANLGSVTGSGANVGGIAGILYRSTVQDSYNTAKVTSTGNFVGGIAGTAGSNQQNQTTDKILRCYNTGDVSTTAGFVGGIVGNGSTVLVQNCYNTGNVTGTTYVAGISATSAAATVEYCYNLGTVTSTNGNQVAGIATNLSAQATVRWNMSLGREVTGSSTFIGRVTMASNAGSIHSNFAWEGMLLNGVTATESVQNGASLSAAEIRSAGAWAFLLGQENSPWTYEEGSLPGLFGQTVAMPEWLAAETDPCAGGHTPGEQTTTKEATCTEEGYIKVTCSVCNEVISNTVLSATGHTEVTDSKEATCTEDGYVKVTCSVCGEELSNTVIPALGHTEVTETVNATCTEDGYVKVTCSVCDEVVSSTVLKAIGHAEATDEQAATCTEDGYIKVTCSVCDEVINNTVLPATGHSYIVIDHKDATYDEDGYDVYTCENCDDGYTVVLPKLGQVTVVSVTVSASVEKLNGNQNRLTITIVEELSDGTENIITETIMINNNAADTYDVGAYSVYVDTKGNDQIRDCRIVE